MNRRFIQTSRPHLIKSLLWELSHESICFEAFRLSTVKKLADGKLLVQQMPQAEEQNSRGGRGPKGKVGIWLTADFVLISLNFPHMGTRSLFLVSWNRGRTQDMQSSWIFHLKFQLTIFLYILELSFKTRLYYKEYMIEYLNKMKKNIQSCFFNLMVKHVCAFTAAISQEECNNKLSL